MSSWECILLRSMRLNFQKTTYRDSNDTFAREKCDRLKIRDPNRCWTQSTAAGRRLIVLLTETSLCYLFLCFHMGSTSRRNNRRYLQLQSLWHCKRLRESTVTTGSFFFLVAVVVRFSLWTFEMWDTVKPPYNTAQSFHSFGSAVGRFAFLCQH